MPGGDISFGAGSAQERSVPLRVSPVPPRDELAYAEVSTPSKADRRTDRDEPPPRRMRATAPAHSKVGFTGADFLEFAMLINRNLQKAGACSQGRVHASPIRCVEVGSLSIPPRGTLVEPSADERGDLHRGNSQRHFTAACKSGKSRTIAAMRTVARWRHGPSLIGPSRRPDQPYLRGGEVAPRLGQLASHPNL